MTEARGVDDDLSFPFGGEEEKYQESRKEGLTISYKYQVQALGV